LGRTDNTTTAEFFVVGIRTAMDAVSEPNSYRPIDEFARIAALKLTSARDVERQTPVPVVRRPMFQLQLRLKSLSDREQLPLTPRPHAQKLGCEAEFHSSQVDEEQLIGSRPQPASIPSRSPAARCMAYRENTEQDNRFRQR
jgi:hypothetical protein